MAPAKFQAVTQYQDYKGTSSADIADKRDISNWLKEKSLINEDEFLIGLNVFMGENAGGQVRDLLQCQALVATQPNFESVKKMIDEASGPVSMRCVDFEINAMDFFGLFKRFSLSISWQGLLEDQEFSCF